MERHQGQEGPYRAWNNASAGGQPRQRATGPGGFKPLSPVRPLAAFPPNEPYQRRAAAPASAPDAPPAARWQPHAWPAPSHGEAGYALEAQGGPLSPMGIPQGAGGYPQNATGIPQGAGGYPQTLMATAQGVNGYPQTPVGYPQDANGYPQASVGTPQAAPPAWPQAWGNPPPAPWAPPPQGTWMSPQGHAPQPMPEPPRRNPRAAQTDPAAPQPAPDATAPWLPPHVTPAPEPAQPVRRILLQTLPQTAPPARPATDWPAAPAEGGHASRAANPAEAASAPQPDAPPPPPAAAPGWPVDDMDGWDRKPDPEGAEEDSGRFEPVVQQRLYEPVPVPTHGYTPRRRGRGKRFLRGLLLMLAAVSALAAALYFTGVLGRLTGLLYPAPAGIPSVFAQPPAGEPNPTVAPAITAPAPALTSFSVSPAMSKAPAQLVFTLETDAAVSLIHLLREDGSTIYASATATPQGDGLLWQVTASFREPYAGRVLAYLQHGAAQWRRGDIACEVTVQ